MAEKYIIGIDEVGRGALAGPVVVAAAAMPKDLRLRIYDLGKLGDSKKLTPKKRVLWFEYFARRPALCYSTARVYPRRIEKMNISKAANLAASRAAARLFENCELKIENCRIFLDGGLYLGNGKEQRANGRWQIVKTIVRGDEKITAVKIASIIAKVSRDRYMMKLSKRYPAYGFEIHKGYGTRKHIKAIKKHGLNSVHRLTFLKRYTTIISKP